MAYTRHGWHIKGTKETPEPLYLHMECGGPGVCRDCNLDVHLHNNGMKKLGD